MSPDNMPRPHNPEFVTDDDSTVLEKAVEAMLAETAPHMWRCYPAHVKQEEVAKRAAIIKSELEKAVPRRNIADSLNHIDAACSDGWNAHHKAMGLE